MTVTWTPDAIISLIATAFVGIVFLLMLEEAIALRSGRDPMSNGVRAVIRRFPRATYAFAVMIGMVLGHLVWP
jgi:VIT1/CCC1 family predicted Fe2+/Mn2+ transporter